MLLKQTKIVATISDQRCEVDFIRQLFEAGMNVVRMNTAHLNREGAEKLINNVRTVSNRIGILMDTKGPEVRTTPLTGDPITFKTGDRVKVVGNPDQATTKECISVSYPNFVHDLNEGGHILIDDGELEMIVIEKHPDYLFCEVQNESTLGSRKSVNVPGVRINLPSLTEKDRNNILFAIEKDIDFIAHSFVRNKQDVLDIRAILDAYQSDIKIIAKIENQEGVDNIDEILEVADGVMIARGDLGIEVPQERIPGIQRLLIRKCILAKKPVIVATQMLESMVHNIMPTRAEASDVATAVYDGVDAVMLSAETAQGDHPVEAVTTMRRIIETVENDHRYRKGLSLLERRNETTKEGAITVAAGVVATNMDTANVIVTFTDSGSTTLRASQQRTGGLPILGLTPNVTTARQLTVVWGVTPMVIENLKNFDDMTEETRKAVLEQKLAKEGDNVVVTAGIPFGKAGTTNMLYVMNI